MQTYNPDQSLKTLNELVNRFAEPARTRKGEGPLFAYDLNAFQELVVHTMLEAPADDKLLWVLRTATAAGRCDAMRHFTMDGSLVAELRRNSYLPGLSSALMEWDSFRAFIEALQKHGKEQFGENWH